jgi:hypothetical protein
MLWLVIPPRVELLQRPEHVHCLMGYVVDLTLILQATFQVSQWCRQVTEDRVNEIIHIFHCSDKKKHIHDTIRAFAGICEMDSVVDKIESLIKDNGVCSSNLSVCLSL